MKVCISLCLVLLTTCVNAGVWKAESDIDPMTKKKRAEYQWINSEEGGATLLVDSKGMVQLSVRKGIFDSTTETNGRIKINDTDPKEIDYWINQDGSIKTAFMGYKGQMRSDSSENIAIDPNLAKALKATKGTIQIEVPMYRTGNKIFTFKVQ